MWERIGTLAAIWLTLCVGLFALFRGFYSFYSGLEIYHRTYRDYRPVIAVKGRDKDDIDLSEYASRHDLKQSPDGDPLIQYSEPEADQDPPEVILDFNDETLKCRGENKYMKFIKLWGYSSLTTLAATGIIVLYHALFEQFEISVTQPPWLIVVGVVVVLSLLHFTIRLASFLPVRLPETKEKRDRLRIDLHNFAFSFIMSAAVFSSMWLFVFYLTGGSLGTVGFGDKRVFWIFGTIFAVPGLLAAVSELVLYKIPIPSDLMTDKVRRKSEIDTSDQS